MAGGRLARLRVAAADWHDWRAKGGVIVAQSAYVASMLELHA